MNAPRFAVPDKWGLCFAGNEAPFCSALDTTLASQQGPFRYVEIGIGYGDCLRAVDDYLTQAGADYTLFGVDIQTCNEAARDEESYPHPERTQIHLSGSDVFLMTFKEKADFVFIDGCHGCDCVYRDFLGAEKIIRPGGVVAFHDTDPGCQDIHWQPHCETGIRARTAVRKLGLLDDTRPGWKKIGETSGDKSKSGHGCLFVQRL